MHSINMDNPKNSEEYLAFAKKIALKSGTILEKYRYSFTIKRAKDTLKLDIATNADYAAEQSLITTIREVYPLHGILAEESGVSLADAEYVWIIDPLDGTKEYTRNSPYYYTLLSLEHKGAPVCAVGYQPAIQRMFSGSLGSGAYVNDKKIHVSTESRLDKSFIHIGIPNKEFPKNEVVTYMQTAQDLIFAAYRLRSTQWDVEGLFNVAMGAVEAYILPPSTSVVGRPKWWDLSSGLQVAEMAVSKITDFYGNPIRFHDPTKGIVASNGLIHTDLLSILKTRYPATC